MNSTEDFVDQRKKKFEDLLNPTDESSAVQEESGDFGEGCHNPGAEVAKVVSWGVL